MVNDKPNHCRTDCLRPVSRNTVKYHLDFKIDSTDAQIFPWLESLLPFCFFLDEWELKELENMSNILFSSKPVRIVAFLAKMSVPSYCKNSIFFCFLISVSLSVILLSIFTASLIYTAVQCQ